MAPVQQHGAFKGRFSEEEQLSFGRWSFLSAGARRLGLGGTRAASTAALSTASSAPCLEIGTVHVVDPQLAGFISAPPRPTGDVDFDYDPGQVRGFLEQLLPANTTVTCEPGAPGADAGSEYASEPSTPRAVEAASSPAKSAWNDSAPGPALCCSTGLDDSSLGCGVSAKFQKQVLERFRQQLLRRFPSLHDAFSQLNHDVSRDRALTPREFDVALERLGVGEEDSRELFDAMDSNSDGSVTLTEFLHALVDVSPEALLWELRCRLIRFDITPHSFRKAFELVRWPQHGWMSRATKVKRRTTRQRRGSTRADNAFESDRADVRRCTGISSDCSTVVGGGVSSSGTSSRNPSRPASASSSAGPGFAAARAVRRAAVPEEAASAAAKGRRPSPSHLSRGDWLKLCTSMFMTLIEAERLFERLADERGWVDLRAMFETLRTTVEPDVSLEEFATKVAARYDSLEAAFRAFSDEEVPNPERLMRWRGFRELAVALHVNNGNAAKFWSLLTGLPEPWGAGATGREAGGAPGDAGDKPGPGEAVAESAFLRELETWAPSAPAERGGRACDPFGRLFEAPRTADRLPSKASAAADRQPSKASAVSPTDLDARPRAGGARGSEAGRSLSSVPSRRGHRGTDAAADTARALRRSGRGHETSDVAEKAVKHETMPIWKQLRTVQGDLRRRYDDGQPSSVAFGGTTPAAEPSQMESPATVDRRKFMEAILGAVKTADTCRSRTVLHNAHRQVLKLEERWASSPKTSLSRGSSGTTTPTKRRSHSLGSTMAHGDSRRNAAPFTRKLR